MPASFRLKRRSNPRTTRQHRHDPADRLDHRLAGSPWRAAESNLGLHRNIDARAHRMKYWMNRYLQKCRQDQWSRSHSIRSCQSNYSTPFGDCKKLALPMTMRYLRVSSGCSCRIGRSQDTSETSILFVFSLQYRRLNTAFLPMLRNIGQADNCDAEGRSRMNCPACGLESIVGGQYNEVVFARMRASCRPVRCNVHLPAIIRLACRGLS